MNPEPLSSLLARTPRLGTARAARLASALLDKVAEGPPGGLRPEGVYVDADEVQRLERRGGDSVEYAAPEAVLGQPLDARADVYAVGVMLFEMLAGRRPFEGKTRGEVVNAHLVREPPPLLELAPEVGAELEGVVRRALAKKPEQRWPSAEAMRQALDAAVAAPPPPPEVVAPDVAAAVVTPEPAVVEAPPASGRTVPSTRRFDAGSSHPPLPPATDPLARASPAPPRHHPRLALVVGAAALVAIVGWFVLRPTPSPSGSAVAVPAGAIPEAMVRRLEAALGRGDLADARAQAESLARAYPHEGLAFALLGHVLFAQGEKERALAAYREAHHLDPRVGEAPELLANLRATFPDARHGEAAFRLAEQIGAPAQSVLSDLAAATGEPRLKRRAAEALGRIRQGETSR